MKVLRGVDGIERMEASFQINVVVKWLGQPSNSQTSSTRTGYQQSIALETNL